MHGAHDDDINRQSNNTTTSANAQASGAADEFLFGDNQSALTDSGGSLSAEDFLGVGDIRGYTAEPNVFPRDTAPQQAIRSHRSQQWSGEQFEGSTAEITAAVNAIPNQNLPWDSSDPGELSWNSVGMAIFNASGRSEEGLAIFHKFSQKSPAKYNADSTDEKWRAFKKCPPDRIGMGSLKFWADQADPNWRKRKTTVEVLPESQYFGERSPPTPPALVKGILPQTGVATIGGQSGTGKSFHAIHLGVRLIPDCNQHFYIDKYRIKRHGGVLYLVLEGKPAFPMRVTAAFEKLLNRQLEFGERFRVPFAWNTYAPNLFEHGPDALLRLADREARRMRQEFGVDLVDITLDTMGLAACFENENMAAQVQRVVAGLQRVSDETGALCINVDHMGKDNDAGMRGTSAKRDCVETILACFIDRDKDNKPTNHRMQLFKVRDGEEGRIIPYRLEQVDMGMDEDGEKITTTVVRWEPDRPPQPKRRPPRKLKTNITLERAINEVGLPVDPDVLKKVFYKFHGGANHAANTAWHRAVDAEGLVLNADGKLDHPL